MQNLFGFQSEAFDPYANMTFKKKLRKMVSKANIKLLLSKDKGFMKQKSLSKTTKVMISQAGANVSGAYEQPVTTAFNTKGKTASVAVNSADVERKLENIDIDKHQDFMTDSMSMAYTMLANKKSFESELIGKACGLTQKEEPDGAGGFKTVRVPAVMAKDYSTFAKNARVLAASSVASGGLKKMNKYLKADATDQESMIGDFIQVLTKGAIAKFPEVEKTIKYMTGLNKTQSSCNDAVAQVQKLVELDIASGKALSTTFEELKNSAHPMVPLYNVVNTKDGLDKDERADNTAGVGQGKLDQHPEEDETGMKPNDKKFESLSDTMDFDQQQKGSHKFFREPRHNRDENIDATAMEKLANDLYESLKGRMGKLANINPAKRLSKRNIASGLTDKIYMSRTEEKGKHLNVNIIIDTSGSMTGQYIRDAKEVTYAMNILAERGIFTGNVILTGSTAHAIIDMPMPRDQVNRIGAYGGGEGIRECFRKFKPEMKQADFNICLTDGMLSDGHIDKDEMTRQGISITGGYVTGTKDTIMEYTGSLNQWFHKSFVRHTTKELILALVASGVMHTKGQ